MMVAVDVFPESLAVGVCNLSVSDNNSSEGSEIACKVRKGIQVVLCG